MAEEEPKVSIENVVASATLNQSLDLTAVAKASSRVEYDPESFPGLVLRLSRPKITLLLFTSGKMVCTGGRSTGEAQRAIKKAVKRLKELGIIILNPPESKIVNVVAKVNLERRVDLLQAAYDLQGMYEPDQFPGLIHRMRDPSVVFLIFASGKAVCTGCSKEEEVYRAVEKLNKELIERNLLLKD